MVIALLLTLAAGAANAQTPDTLAGTAWQLVKFQGGDGKTLTPDDKSKYSIEFGTDGAVSARVNCNRGRATWKSAGPGQLELGPLALTRMMCPSDPVQDRFARDWLLVRSYVFRNGHLFLSLMADGGIYEFEPVAARPASPTSAVASTGPFTFFCTRDTRASGTVNATFYQTQPAMVLLTRNGVTTPAFQVVAASGTKYEGHDVMFWEAHGEASVTWSGISLTCARR
jgi:heat shock protein HslJ/membrane-bound inhibitor of C-type lysozyme